MDLIWFTGLLVCLYFGTFIGLYFWVKKHFNVLPQKLPAAVAGFLTVMFMVGLAVCHFLFSMPKLAPYTMIGVVLVALLFLAAKWPDKKKIWVPIICIAGTYVLHRLAPEKIPVDYITYGAMSLSWIAMMTLVVFFDRLPLLSFFIIATWAFAFATVVFIDGIIPLMLAIVCWLVVAPLWAVIRVSAEEMKGSLGSFGSAFLGFMMGGIIATCVGFGAYNSALSLTSYYLFEILMFCLPWIGIHPLGIEKGQSVYMVALQKGSPKRVVRALFYHLMALSLIAVLAWKTRYTWSVWLIIVIILLDVYNRYKLFGNPDPSVRQLWRDAKAAIKDMLQPENGKDVIKENAETNDEQPKLESSEKVEKHEKSKRKKKK